MTRASYDDLLARVRRLVVELDRPPVVGISGHGGAGKTTLARRLAGDLGTEVPQVVALDRMYAATARDTRGLFDLHDWPRVTDLLRRLRERPVPARLAYPTRQWSGETGRHDVAMPPVVVVEGIRLLRPETVALLDLAVWIDLDVRTAAARAVARNREQGDDPAELDLWATRWVPEGEDYERTVGPAVLADVVIEAGGPRLGWQP